MDQVEMEQLWSEHLDGEFAAKDVEATLETMTRDPHAARPEAATPCDRPRISRSLTVVRLRREDGTRATPC